MLADFIASMGVAALAIVVLIAIGGLVFAIGTYNPLVAMLFLLFALITLAHFCITH